MSENELQISVIKYCDIRRVSVVHIPNESKRTVSYGSLLKRMGMRKGFPDLFFPIARKGYHGLFIEMKTDKGKLGDDQLKWLKTLSKEGYLCKVCRTLESAVELIDYYVFDFKP